MPIDTAPAGFEPQPTEPVPDDTLIDDLLAKSLRPEPMRAQMQTGPYDAHFFGPTDIDEPERDHLERARTALATFMVEADLALETADINIEQRLHISQIVAFIDGLANRFDRVRDPAFAQSRP